MNGLVIGLVLLVVPGCYRDQTLDKTGTSGCESAAPALETLKKQEPAGAGSFLAERAGFEPAVGFYPHAALAKRCFRPLSHLSECCISLLFVRFLAFLASWLYYRYTLAIVNCSRRL
jgi:hypothetical protein